MSQHHRLKNKKGQEEMVGFVLIMLVVAVIFLVFLGIFLRNGGSKEETGNIEIDQFLGSAVQYTTTCREYNPYTVKELVVECSTRPNEPCDASPDSPKKCDVLKSTLKAMVEAGWNFGPDSPNKGYLIQAIRDTPTGVEIVGNISISGYGSTSTVRSAETPLRDGVILYLEIYS